MKASRDLGRGKVGGRCEAGSVAPLSYHPSSLGVAEQEGRCWCLCGPLPVWAGLEEWGLGGRMCV